MEPGGDQNQPDFYNLTMGLEPSKVVKLEDYEYHWGLGKGAFGMVRKCAAKALEHEGPDGEEKQQAKKQATYAVKFQSKYQICAKKTKFHIISGIWNEIRIMNEMDHPFVLRM